MRNTIRIGTIAGIEVHLHHTGVILFGLLTWSLAGHYLMVGDGWSSGVRWGLATITALLVFGSILLHELGHSLVAKAVGTPVRSVTLFVFGGVAEMTRAPKRGLHEFLIAAAGPVINFVLAALFGWISLLGGQQPITGIAAIAGWLASINLTLALFNLIPAFPLDGGRIVRAIVWGVSGDLRRATRVAASIGSGIAWLFILLGIWRVVNGAGVGGLSLALIGWFLLLAARSHLQQATIQGALHGHTADEAMLVDCPHVPRRLTLDVAAEQIVEPSNRHCFPVTEQGELRGLLTRAHIEAVPRERRPYVRVEDVMIPRRELTIVLPNADLAALFERMTAHGLMHFPVVEHGHLLGVVGPDALQTFMRRGAAVRAYGATL